MSVTVHITPELEARVAAIAERTRLSPSEIIADALQNGHSLEWQERFVERVAAGIAAADAGEFAHDKDINAVLSKFRPA
ncbi:transcriptional regulator [Devosia sp. 63-57]|uniref:transcriptional regulator n=1 Tax=Devosia sp. 63-57 TaxID=1895751 RepID=UPI00086B02EE|nr:transcriptional regulator [Devosia sp. 63-57]ODT49632.1 MAG: transcriptional regulator [Pelagibacterium sp. SCN 63-126]ODU87645.1 MAG: transcriptional regulator [Pelagibacterium sp. SCN 63-17]OJX45647.1 MAG: transcriptional regulator [Devosia sp. 63-57]